MQERSVSSALAMESLQSRTKSLTQLVSYQCILCIIISFLVFSILFIYIYILSFLFLIFIFFISNFYFSQISYYHLLNTIFINFYYYYSFSFPKLNCDNYFNYFHITFSPHSLIFFPSLIVIIHANVYECPAS